MFVVDPHATASAKSYFTGSALNHSLNEENDLVSYLAVEFFFMINCCQLTDKYELTPTVK